MASASPDPSRSDDSGLSDQYEDLPGLVLGRLTDAANALLRAVQAQPVVAAAIIAAGAGVLIGVSLARRGGSRAGQVRETVLEEVAESGKRARKAGRRGGQLLDYGELLPLAMRLFENPIVRGYVLRTATRMIAKRFK
jgi:hypothetical protein